MSEITYICPFRKEVWGRNEGRSGEFFMPCTFEECSLCSVGETDTSITYYCNNPTTLEKWQIKREIKQF